MHYIHNCQLKIVEVAVQSWILCHIHPSIPTLRTNHSSCLPQFWWVHLLWYMPGMIIFCITMPCLSLYPVSWPLFSWLVSVHFWTKSHDCWLHTIIWNSRCCWNSLCWYNSTNSSKFPILQDTVYFTSYQNNRTEVYSEFPNETYGINYEMFLSILEESDKTLMMVLNVISLFWCYNLIITVACFCLNSIRIAILLFYAPKSLTEVSAVRTLEQSWSNHWWYWWLNPGGH